MPFPAVPVPTGYAPAQVLNGGYPGAIDPDSYYNADIYGGQQIAPEDMAAYQQQFWVPKIATGGYIPPEFNNPEAMAALGQTDAWNQRQQYLEAQGQQRYETLLNNRADSAAGSIAPRAALLLGAGAGTLGGIFGGAGAGGAVAAGGAAGGNAAAGLSEIGLPAGVGYLPGGTAAGAAAAGSGFAGGSAGAVNALAGGAAASRIPDWVSNYLEPGLNAALGVYGANQAMDAETDAMDRAIAEEGRQFDLTRADWQPWMDTGRDALTQLNDPLNYFQKSPDYDFVRSEGTRDVGNSWASVGGSQSGNAQRALVEFNQDLASGEFGNWFNRQASRAGIGTTGTNAVTNARSNATGATSNYLANQGVSRASGVLGRTNAVQNGIFDALDNRRYNHLYRRRAA